MIFTDLFESQQSCPECGGPSFSDMLLAEKHDACYNKVRSRYKVWPSAYASGALVQCRKKGAANWGNKSESMAEGSNNVGDTIRVLYQKIYDQGDDALEYLNTHAKNFARYWDRFEGDLDSMIDELPPKILARLAQELQIVAGQEGLSESRDMCHVCGQTPCNCTYIGESHDNGEYSDEAGMAHGNLITIAKAARGLLDTIDQHEDLPEWVQEKIAKVEGMLVSAWNYLQSQEAQGIDPRVEEMYANLAENWQRVSHRLELNQEFDMIESTVESIARRNGVDAEAVWADLESLTEDELYVFAVTSEPIMEDWQKANKRDKTDGMSRKAVKAYRREHPGSKLQTAVTTKPSKLKKGSKASKRRKSYCSRSRGQMKMHNISCAKTPDKAICKARRRWNCEGVDRSDLTVVAEGSGYDGSGPLDLSKNPSVNDVFKRALYIHDYEGYGNNMDYSEDEAIDHYVERKFGQDVLNQLNKARYHSYFGREGGNKGGHIRSSNLGQASDPVGRFRTTKAGKMHGQDAKVMKSKVADRLGRHPAPTLPEGVAEMDSQGYKGTRDEGDPYAKGGKATPVKAKDVVKQGVKALNKAHPKTWHDVDPKLGKQVDRMSKLEKVKKGLAHPDTLKKPGVAEGLDRLDSFTRKVLNRMQDDSWLSAERAYFIQKGAEQKMHTNREQYNQEIQRFIDLYRQYKGKQGVAEADDPKFVGFMNRAMANKVDAPKADPLAKAPDWYKNAPAMNFDSMPSHKKALQFGLKVLSKLDPETKQQLAAGGEQAIVDYLVDVSERTLGARGTIDFVEEDIWECQDYLSNVFHDPNITSWVDVLKTGLNEVSDATLTSYLTKVDADARKHRADPTKRSAEKRNRSVSGFARAFNKLDARKEKVDELSKQKLGDYLHAAHQDVVDRATSSSFQSGKAGDKYNKADVSPKEKQRQAGMARAVTRLTRENSMADELAQMAMKRNPNALVRVDGKTMQSPVPGPKPAGTTAPRPAPKFDPEAEYSDDYSAWHRRTKGLSEGSSIAEAWTRRYPNINKDIAECKTAGDSDRLNRLMAIKNIIDGK